MAGVLCARRSWQYERHQGIMRPVLESRVISRVASLCALELVLVAMGCAGGDRPASSVSAERSTAEDGATEEASDVPLAEPAPDLAQQCLAAARSLGFAVPCPTRLPLVAASQSTAPETASGSQESEEKKSGASSSTSRATTLTQVLPTLFVT